MHTLSKIALLAVAGGLSLSAPALAAPPMRGPQLQQYCADPAHAKDPQCLQGNTNRNGSNNNNPNRGGGPGGNGSPGGTGMSGPGGNYGGPPPSGFKFNNHDRDVFRQRFHGFNFGVFPTPGFGITLGVHVPHSYSLKPVPRSIYRYYPQFRGYLFFATRNGSIVIVSPRSYRIVAVL